MGAWHQFFGGDRYSFTTPLTPSECAERLSAITASSSVGMGDEMRVWQGLPGDVYDSELSRHPLRGKVSLRGFRVARRIRMLAPPLSNLSSYRMLFETWANGTLASEATGTRITVTMTVFRGVGCFWSAVLGMTILFLAAVVARPQAWSALIFPALFMGLGAAARLAARTTPISCSARSSQRSKAASLLASRFA